MTRAVGDAGAGVVEGRPLLTMTAEYMGVLEILAPLKTAPATRPLEDEKENEL